MSFLLWLESTGFGTFVRESESKLAYPTFVTLHTIGMAVIVGISSVLALRLTGFAPTIPLAPLRRLFPIMWFGFAINLFSGTGLAAAAASTTIPNPLFITKMTCVLTAVSVMALLQVKVFRDPELDHKPVSTMSKILGALLLVLWLLGMIAGRLIGYTDKIFT